MKDNRYRAVLADMDGTMFRGTTLIPGSDSAYHDLAARGIRWLFISNNAAVLARDLAVKLTDLGVQVSEDQFVNSASALLRALEREKKGLRVLVVGEARLIEGLESVGVTVVDDPKAAEIVVSAIDRGFTFDKLVRAQNAIHRGALYWATNLDSALPVEDGVKPGAGSIAAAISTAAGRGPDRVFGKPAEDMAEIAMEILGLPRESCLVVGDRMETDILLARNAGMDSALVLTGATSMEDLSEFPYRPDHILESIAQLPDLFQ